MDIFMPVTLVLGGARSGKSRFAEKLASEIEGPRVYIATAEARDEEMAARIKRHRDDRGDTWITYEETLNIAELIQRISSDHPVMLVDCLTLWLSNLMEQDLDPEKMVDALVASSRGNGSNIIFVSNEVGLGIVPNNALARTFRDEAGRMNARLAEAADIVYFVAAGLPLKMKDVSE
jgi:adenosylcobinamide kinase/adenosylcobinamide-phosphate guanylyltransferase